ncbi:MAG: ATP-binding protein [bacterium]|nr:ATP-binding protein [bacterium]
MNVLSNLDLLSVGIAIASTVVLGFSVLLNNPKSITNKTFFVFSILTAFWGFFNLMSYRIVDLNLAFWFLRIEIFLGIWHSFMIFQLLYVFPNERLKFHRWYTVMLIPVVVTVSLLTLTPFVFSGVETVSKEGQILTLKAEAGIVFFGLTVFGLILSSFWILLRKTLKASGQDKRKFLLLLIGVAITFALILPLNFVLPAFFNNPKFVPFGAVFTFPFVIFTSYAILRHKLFNIRVAGTAILVFLLSVVTFSEVIFAQDLGLVIYRSSIFIFVLTFGILLIRGVLREVEQRERLEKLTAELETTNARLEKLDELKSQFLSFASHQIKGPLTVINGYADLISEGSYGQINGGVSKAVWGIKENSRRLIKLVDDFLDLRKIEEDRMDYEFKTINLVALAKSVFEEYKIVGQQKGLELGLQTNEITIDLKADEQRLRQVIQNLVDNAIKYTPEGEVKVKIERTKTGDKAVVEVKDSGVGIRPEIIGTIFNQFSRDPKLRNTLGTGLGLYIAKEIVKAHRGKIWAESEGEGKGATFYVELPLS